MPTTKKTTIHLLFTAGLAVMLGACTNSGINSDTGDQNSGTSPAAMARILEESLFQDILDHWYPRNIDSVHGGYISGYERDWSLSRRQEKSLVQQARHTWATGFVLEHYPKKKEYLDYSRQGKEFLKDQMWDEEFGGFHTFTRADGSPMLERGGGKLVYGQSFALYGLAQYHLVSGDPEALELAKKGFFWIEEHAHDKENGGYFEFMERDGSVIPDPGQKGDMSASPGLGLKDYNSSIHVMEGLTNLYRVWPDELLRERLEEMFYLIRDTFVHPDGFLQLYFYPDWTLVPDEIMVLRSGGNDYHTQHITYGHDVETAFLLLETAHVLGMGEDELTHEIAKKIVDHSLDHGWDDEKGGFFYMGKIRDGQQVIIDSSKAFWVEIEALNALLLMHTLHPEDPRDYYGKFLHTWEYIDTYLIDHEYGGWYSNGFDTNRRGKNQGKSNGWKTTYHNTRGMVHCIEMLHGLEGGIQPVNPHATKEARELLAFLAGIRGKYILSGQHNYAHELNVYTDSVMAITGKLPVVWGSDFSFREETIARRQAMIDKARARYEQGHIITLMYHQVRPMDDEPGGWKESVQNEVSAEEWEAMLTPGTEIHRKWEEKTDRVAGYLKQLQEAGIPVLWRPYHEMNGIWFWWGDKQDFERLWIQLYERLVDHHGLNNLIWVWNANAPREKENDDAFDYVHYLPPLEYVDILAADVYHNDYKQSHHDQLLELGKGKVIALGECGQAPTPEILDNQDQWTWFMIWTRWLWTNNKREEIIRLYNDPRVVTLDELPSIR